MRSTKTKISLALAISFLTLLFALPGASPLKKPAYFPSEFAKLRLNMPMKKALKKRKESKTEDSFANFRITVSEEINRDGISSAIYYFDNEGDKPFYELIILYDNERLRDEAAASLFGAPNHKGKEWLQDFGLGFQVYAWAFQNKLVIVGKIEGTEWE